MHYVLLSYANIRTGVNIHIFTKRILAVSILFCYVNILYGSCVWRSYMIQPDKLVLYLLATVCWQMPDVCWQMPDVCWHLSDMCWQLMLSAEGPPQMPTHSNDCVLEFIDLMLLYYMYINNIILQFCKQIYDYQYYSFRYQ